MKGIYDGPAVISVSASPAVFMQYTGGVITDKGCYVVNDHAVLLVGWGRTTEGLDYWVVRNSWGASWGEKGYVRIARSEGDGICGVNREFTRPVV